GTCRNYKSGFRGTFRGFKKIGQDGVRLVIIRNIVQFGVSVLVYGKKPIRVYIANKLYIEKFYRIFLKIGRRPVISQDSIKGLFVQPDILLEAGPYGYLGLREHIIGNNPGGVDKWKQYAGQIKIYVPSKFQDIEKAVVYNIRIFGSSQIDPA